MNTTIQENHTWSTTHRISAEDKAAMSAMRVIVEPNKGRLQGMAARVPFDAIMERVAAPAGVTYEAGTVGGVSGWWCRPEDPKSGEAILHIHGGWFNWGSAQASGISLAIWLLALVWQHSCRTIGSPRSIPFR
jgi:epsilon-lactone hydrolase